MDQDHAASGADWLIDNNPSIRTYAHTDRLAIGELAMSSLCGGHTSKTDSFAARTIENPCYGDHWLQFYNSDQELVTPLSRYFCSGLQTGDGIVILADKRHRNAISQILPQRALEAACESGSLSLIDSEEALSGIMRGSCVDINLLNSLVTYVINQARKASSSGKVRVFGEIVSVFSGLEQFDQVLELERNWNGLLKQIDFSLLCAYPSAHFAKVSYQKEFASICQCHTNAVAKTGIVDWIESFQYG